MKEETLKDTLHVECEQFVLTPSLTQTVRSFTDAIEPGDTIILFIDDDGKFYFMVPWHFDWDRFADQSGFLVAQVERYNAEYYIGFGIYNFDSIRCLMYNNMTEEEMKPLRDILYYLFRRKKIYTFFPGTTKFKHKFELNGHPCYAIHDYVKKEKGEELPIEDNAARTLVFRMKQGKCPELAARFIALAIGEEPNLIGDPKNTILIPIPASKAKGHEKRFRKLCADLSRQLGIIDGYSLIELVMERNPDDIRKGMPLSNAMRLTDDERVKDKALLILDDVCTSGGSFIQMADYLLSADARSVTGIFIAKTI